MSKVKWHGREVESEVRQKMVMQLNRMGAMGERFSKIRIKEAGRIDTANMYNSVTFEQANPVELSTRYGSNVYYTVYQELGTERGIKPMYALRGALDDIKQAVK